MTKSDASNPLERICYTCEETGAVLGIDKERVSGMVSAGLIPHIRIGARILIGKKALEQWVTESCMANGPALLAALPPTRTPLNVRVANARRRRPIQVSGQSHV